MSFFETPGIDVSPNLIVPEQSTSRNQQQQQQLDFNPKKRKRGLPSRARETKDEGGTGKNKKKREKGKAKPKVGDDDDGEVNLPEEEEEQERRRRTKNQFQGQGEQKGKGKENINDGDLDEKEGRGDKTSTKPNGKGNKQKKPKQANNKDGANGGEEFIDGVPQTKRKKKKRRKLAHDNNATGTGIEGDIENELGGGDDDLSEMDWELDGSLSSRSASIATTQGTSWNGIGSRSQTVEREEEGKGGQDISSGDENGEGKTKKDKKRKRGDDTTDGEGVPNGGTEGVAGNHDGNVPKVPVSSNKRERKRLKSDDGPIVRSHQPQPQSPAHDSHHLTPLQQKMSSKLSGARFRWLNEKLYNSTGEEANKLMKKDDAIGFEEYHSGFRHQTQSWPSHPLTHIIHSLQLKYPTTNQASTCLIADLGCGEGGLAKELVPKGFKVIGVDLVGDLRTAGNEGGGKENGRREGWVVEGECTRLGGVPLPGGETDSFPTGEPSSSQSQSQTKKPNANGRTPDEVSSSNTSQQMVVFSGSQIVDVVVMCLSLMSTNWTGMIREGRRVLKMGGSLKIAEVASRFNNLDKFVGLIESVGFKLTGKDTTNSHFYLFDFVKAAPTSSSSASSSTNRQNNKPKSTFASTSATPLLCSSGHGFDWDKAEKMGKELLRPCVYKKR